MADPVYTPQQLRKDVRGTFIEALMAPRAPSILDRAATIINSESDKENYAWLGEIAQSNEFVDTLEYADLLETADDGYELLNKKWTLALSFLRDTLADGKVGGNRQRILDMAARMRARPIVELTNLLINGTTGTDYTGEVFFYATHAVRQGESGTQSNIVTGAGTTTANIASAIGDAIAALYNFEDESGQPLNEFYQKLWIEYPPAIHKQVSEAVSAGIVANTSNVQFADHNIDYNRNARLTSDSVKDFYVGIMDAEVRALIWQDREGVTLEEQGPGSDRWFEKEKVAYKARMRGVSGYGRWQRAVKVDVT